jgi:hypothetical protein
MKAIALPRGGGKTTKLIKMASETDGYIVCHSIDECSRIFADARMLGVKINQPITYEEFRSKKYGRIKNFYIDNIENFLQYLTNVPVYGFTISSEILKK